ncbi:MAG: hypothetical protein ACRENO_07630 [Thermodesulfobacteriota bacterium]
MNLTSRFSISKIVSEYTHYIFCLDFDRGKKCWLFSNAEDFEKRNKCIGTEIKKDLLNEILKEIYRKKKYDFTVYGKCCLIESGEFKISLNIDCELLKGSYIMLIPGWGKSYGDKIWILIPSNKLKI